MIPQEAAKETIELIINYKSKYSIDGNTVEHALWMLLGISAGYIQHEKAHRWLGYAQAIIIANGISSLCEMKRINREAK